MRLRLAVDITAWDPQKEEIDFLLSLFTQEDSDHCRKYHFFDDRKRAIVSRLLQRHGAAVALGIPHQHVTIKRTKGRKPYITNSIQKPQAPNYNYSISHEGDYVVLASEPLCICGCDVAAPQQVRRGKDQNLADIFKSFEKQFSPKEWAAIKAHSPDEAAMERAFRQHWSLKEAYVKATGLGLALDLGSIAFTITVDGNNNNNTNAATVEYGGKQQTDWAFHLHELGRGHWVSVARAPLSVVVDAWGGFKDTFQKLDFSVEEFDEVLKSPEPPFTLLAVSDLLEKEVLDKYEAAGGEVVF